MPGSTHDSRYPLLLRTSHGTLLSFTLVFGYCEVLLVGQARMMLRPQEYFSQEGEHLFADSAYANSIPHMLYHVTNVLGKYSKIGGLFIQVHFTTSYFHLLLLRFVAIRKGDAICLIITKSSTLWLHVHGF